MMTDDKTDDDVDAGGNIGDDIATTAVGDKHYSPQISVLPAFGQELEESIVQISGSCHLKPTSSQFACVLLNADNPHEKKNHLCKWAQGI